MSHMTIWPSAGSSSPSTLDEWVASTSTIKEIRPMLVPQPRTWSTHVSGTPAVARVWAHWRTEARAAMAGPGPGLPAQAHCHTVGVPT